MIEMYTTDEGQSRSEDGASAVEYGLMITGSAGLIVAMVFLFGGFVGVTFSHDCNMVKDQFNAHEGSASC